MHYTHAGESKVMCLSVASQSTQSRVDKKKTLAKTMKSLPQSVTDSILSGGEKGGY